MKIFKYIKGKFNLKRAILGFILSIFLAIVFGIICLPLLQPAEGNQTLEQLHALGQVNILRTVTIFGVLTGIYAFISFKLNFYKYSAIFLILYWILGASVSALLYDPNLVGKATVTNICNEQKTIAAAKNASVLIAQLNQSNDVIAYGSGMALADAKTSGLVLTNFHVLEGIQSPKIWSGREDVGWISANVFASYPDSDIVILKVDHVFPQTISLMDSDTLIDAETLYAIGWPNTYTGEAVTTRGIFSRRHTENGIEIIQTDASINPGNSGGALINKCGVIGMNTAKLTWSSNTTPAEGIGYALSSNYISSITQNRTD